MSSIKPKINISISQEHSDKKKDIEKVLSDFDVNFIGNLRRCSAEELAMQITFFITSSIVGGLMWDLFKTGIKKIFSKFNKAQIIIRDDNSIIYSVKKDLTVSVFVIPERMKEFEHIKNIDDLIKHFESSTTENSKWKKKTLNDIGSFSKGSGITKEQLVETGFGAIRYGDLYTKYDFKIKNIECFINSDVALQSKEIKKGDILFAGSGETIDDIGKSAVYTLEEKAFAGGDIIIFRSKKDNGTFLAYLLNTGKARKRLRELGEGQSVVHIYKDDLKTISVNLPSKKEQDRIVSVLETWDKAIEKLRQKIEIKEKIKKGLSQKLLSGTKRLSDFNDEWDFVKLKDVGFFRAGNGFPEIYQGISKEHFPFFKVSDMNHAKNKIFMNTANNYISEKVKKEIKSYVFPKDTIVLAKIGAAIFLERKRILTQPSCIDNNMIGFVVNKDFYQKFIFYRFLQIKFGRYVSATSLPSLSGVELSDLDIKIPLDIKEQKAIANILNSADKEIEVLEKKLKLLKEQKKYLLNNLVTGQIRTPENLLEKVK